MRKKKNDNKVVQLTTKKSTVVKNKSDLQKEMYQECKQLVNEELSTLFDNNKFGCDNYSVLYAISFYLAQHLTYMRMPIVQYMCALKKGSEEAIQDYLNLIAEDHSLIGVKKEKISEIPSNRVLN